MPVIDHSSYPGGPFWMPNPHLETIVPSMFFKVEDSGYSRERLELPDGDFLDLDWIKADHDKLMIITHGLEGSADRYYVKRSAKFFKQLQWDVLAWNCRSCSGEINRLARFYHHGDTADLGFVIQHALANGVYNSVVLLGYSMGGSMSLKYLGERNGTDQRIKGAIGFSVPCNLRDSAKALKRRENRIYEKRFLKKLKKKIILKAEKHSDVDVSHLAHINDFDTFHEWYTVPLHGFTSIDDFYDSATCDQYLPFIDVPVLIANALNDPMLEGGCYPSDLASSNSHIYLETPAKGGHVGFTLSQKPYSWMEYRSDQFIKETLAII
ncbi:MAG: alpha/beta hydrolase [Cyclobacteriaceae bacterium]|nr:alpha/beta hydrolase [Cyclobacteriaceae bacterium HetDA_MAG_MS6]